MPDDIVRSMTFDVFVPDEQRQPVLNSIRKYRAVCRQCYAALLLAQTAGAELHEDTDRGPRLNPDGDRSKLVLAAALGSARIERGERVRGEGQQYAVRSGSGLADE